MDDEKEYEADQLMLLIANIARYCKEGEGVPYQYQRQGEYVFEALKFFAKVFTEDEADET